jgi:hypothetical protein
MSDEGKFETDIHNPKPSPELFNIGIPVRA